jgi:glycosyltransferase involved in cell wall biosynthesis
MMAKPELSLVMPAYNEERNLDLVIERVDDGSFDKTRICLE